MEKKFIAISILILYAISGFLICAQSSNDQALISQIKLNSAYINATGTANSNDEAMDDARTRLKTEIYDWLNDVVPASPVKDTRIEGYRNWIKSKVKIQFDEDRRITFNDTLKAYSGIMAQGEDVKFIDRKVGKLIRAFGFISKNQVLPGIVEEQELPEKIQTFPSLVEEKTKEDNPIISDTPVVVLAEAIEVPVEESVETEQNEVKENEGTSPSTPVYNDGDTVVLNNAPSLATNNEPITNKVSDNLDPDKNVVDKLLEIRTLGEMNKYMGYLKNNGLLVDYGTAFNDKLNGCYLILFDSHKIIRERLWYNGKDVVYLNNGDKGEISKMLKSYPNLLWFKTKRQS